MTLARISITIPGTLLAAADRRARELDRSRSWVVAEAVRRYTQQVAQEEPQVSWVREVPREPYPRPGPGEFRLAQLEADLALTPEGRVKQAEAAGHTNELGRRQWDWQRLLVFDRYEDFLTWERWADRSPP
ncbi:MAG: ribbon-helix-helix protein, CopG family [Gemmatimonadota bacterium]|nr:MAG: ribbon-helix-helix protein, CopG family [Gemmatimonadota bacterium]